MKLRSLLNIMQLLLVSVCANSQTVGDFRSAQTAVSFSNSSHWQTWDGSQWNAATSVPGSNNDIYVQAGHTVTLSAAASCNNLFISTGTTSATSGGDGQLALGVNTLSVNGKLACYFGTVNTTAGSSLGLSITPDNNTPSSPITKGSGGALKFVGGSRTLVNASEWGAGATGSNSLFDVEFALNTGETGIVTAVLKAANWRIISGIINVQSRIAVDNGTTGQGDLTINDGATLLSAESGTSKPVISRTTSAICGVVTINGLLKLTGANPYLQCTSYTMGSKGCVEYARSGNQTFVASSFSGAANLLNYKNISLSGSGNKTTLDNQTTSLLSDGTLSISGGNLVLGSSATFTVSTTNTTLSYNGAVSQTITTTEWSTNFQNVEINNASGVSLGFNRSIQGELRLYNGVLSHGGNLNINSGATIIRKSGSMATAPGFGSLINLSYQQSTSIITIGHEVPDSSHGIKNLIVNNSYGVVLSKTTHVFNKLDLQTGVLTSGSTNMPVLSDSAIITGGSASAFISGPIKKYGNTAITFPIGKSGRYAPCGISNVTGSSNYYFILEYFPQSPSNPTSLGSSLSSGRISSVEYWRIIGSNNQRAQVNLFWENGSYSGITTTSGTDLVVAGFNGSTWISYGNKGISGSSTSGNLVSDSTRTWGDFTFGSLNNNNPLPVKLQFVKCEEGRLNTVDVKWATASEINNYGFEVQKSIGRKPFETIGFVTSYAIGGNSSQIINYSFSDKETSHQTTYYRLLQIDYDGMSEFSDIVKWERKSDYLPPEFVISGNQLFLMGESDLFTTDITDISGITVLHLMNNRREVDLSKLNTGIYFIRINNSKPVKVWFDPN